MYINPSLERAATSWLNKSILSVGSYNPNISSRLIYIRDNINNCIQDINDNNTHINKPDVIKRLSDCISELNEIKNKELWPDTHHYRCVYEGGDGSTYESGAYRDTEVNNVIEAIEKIKEIVSKNAEL